MSFTNILATGILPETMTECRRVVADSGVIIDQKYMDRTIRTLKAQGIYSSCKFLADANFAVKKDGAGAVSILYDISGNNNDAPQATGANQPIWTAAQQNGKAGLVFTGTSVHKLGVPAIDLTGTKAVTLIMAVKGLSNDGVHNTFFSHEVDSVTNAFYVQKNDTNIFYVIGRGDVGYAGYKTTGTILTNAYVLSAIHNRDLAAGETIGYINGDSTGAIFNNSNNTNAFDNATSNIGVRDVNSQPLTGTIMPMTLFNVALSTAQRQAMENLLNSYFAIY